MSLKKKIILSFLISSVIIVALAAALYVNLIEITKEIHHLELLDTVRSKSLQLRRHEKNYLLYMEAGEIRRVRTYLREISGITREKTMTDGGTGYRKLQSVIVKYEGHIDRIESSVAEFRREFRNLSVSDRRYASFSSIVESTFLERPMVVAALLEKSFSLPSDSQVIRRLYELGTETERLRKNGEEILTVSKDLDRAARERVEHSIEVLQTAVLVLLPLFFMVGLVTLFLISQSVVKRLKILTEAVRRTGEGNFAGLTVPEKRDEVGVLIAAFNSMENDLAMRDEELRKKKDEELLRNRKLASIGILASGVAHELNNPLNNIHISAQILERETGATASAETKEIMKDILSQTIRAKSIVGDLLEFARGREPQLAGIELNELLRRAYKLVGVTSDTEGIEFNLDTDPGGAAVVADPEQMERVFINLFSNAVDAMSGKGSLKIIVRRKESVVSIRVSDSGRGMSPETMDKIFEPFYTTKDRGTGLGLAIVFNIIKRHGGDITVESREGQGTSFTVTLPAGENMHGT